MEDEKIWDEYTAGTEGGITMTIEKALDISLEEFVGLDEECKGFDDEVYKNHQVHRDGESIGEFLKKGSLRIVKDPIIKGDLGDGNCD